MWRDEDCSGESGNFCAQAENFLEPMVIGESQNFWKAIWKGEEILVGFEKYFGGSEMIFMGLYNFFTEAENYFATGKYFQGPDKFFRDSGLTKIFGKLKEVF